MSPRSKSRSRRCIPHAAIAEAPTTPQQPRLCARTDAWATSQPALVSWGGNGFTPTNLMMMMS